MQDSISHEIQSIDSNLLTQEHNWVERELQKIFLDEPTEEQKIASKPEPALDISGLLRDLALGDFAKQSCPAGESADDDDDDDSDDMDLDEDEDEKAEMTGFLVSIFLCLCLWVLFLGGYSFSYSHQRQKKKIFRSL